MTGLRENIPELPEVIDLAARVGVHEVYLQRMVFGFGEDALARADQSIYDGFRAQIEPIIAEAERRAVRHGVSFRRRRCAQSTPESCRPSCGAGAVARMQSTAASGLRDRARHGAAMLHQTSASKATRKPFSSSTAKWGGCGNELCRDEARKAW